MNSLRGSKIFILSIHQEDPKSLLYLRSERMNEKMSYEGRHYEAVAKDTLSKTILIKAYQISSPEVND